jgi:hypothetical protein
MPGLGQQSGLGCQSCQLILTILLCFCPCALLLCCVCFACQVGSGSQDHGIWGRPEDIKNSVPVYTVNPGSPGSDVVAAMGATLGAAAVAFKRADEAYSKQLLASAIKAYEFATAHIGKYSDSVSDAGAFYRSSNLYDDIATNAIW